MDKLEKVEKKRKKTGGRKPGTPNKVTGNMRVQVGNFLSKNWYKVQKDFNKLEPKEKLFFIEKLLKYTTPALSSLEAKIDYEKLSDEDLDLLIDKLLTKYQ
jgi:hypothetical protein